MNHTLISIKSAIVRIGLITIASSLTACGHGLLQSGPIGSSSQGRAHPFVARHLTTMLDGNTVPTSEYAREQPYIDWVGNANNQNAGTAQSHNMKILWYTNIARLKDTNPFYNNLNFGDFARNCSGAQVYALAPGETVHLYLTDPSSPHLRSLYETTGGSNGMSDAVADSADAVDYDAAAKWRGIQNGLPCHAPSYSVQWTRQEWIDASAQFILQAAIDTHFRLGPNGLSTAMGYNGLDVLGQWVTVSPQFASDIAAGQTPPTTTGLDAGGGFGGRDEGCYGPGGFLTHYTDREYDSTWTSYENTEIQVGLIDNAHFICMYGYGLADGANALPGRMYGFASYMLTYNPQTNILFDAFSDANGDQGDPEEQLVFLDPVGVSNANLKLISSLLEPGGGYGREYNSCYQNGTLIGKCAVMVNSNSTGNVNWPSSFTGYARTLTLRFSVSGATILNGGTATIGSPAPPATVGPGSAVIAFQ